MSGARVKEVIFEKFAFRVQTAPLDRVLPAKNCALVHESLRPFSRVYQTAVTERRTVVALWTISGERVEGV